MDSAGEVDEYCSDCWSWFHRHSVSKHDGQCSDDDDQQTGVVAAMYDFAFAVQHRKVSFECVKHSFEKRPTLVLHPQPLHAVLLHRCQRNDIQSSLSQS